MFNLLELHDSKEDIGAKSWICVKGRDLLPMANDIINEICNRNIIFRKTIADSFAKKFSCSVGPFEEVFFRKKEWLPIPLINELISIWITFHSEEEVESKIKEINRKIQFLKANTAKSKPIKAVKSIDKTTCKIIGAMMADGNITHQIGIESKTPKVLCDIIDEIRPLIRKHNFTINKTKRGKFRTSFVVSFQDVEKISPILIKRDITVWKKFQIDLTDGDIKAVEVFKVWIKRRFGINVKIKKFKKKNAWRINFDNKIISRFFIRFFDMPIGNKTDFVFEPKIIKEAGLKFRKAFLIGVMSFDGSVNKVGSVDLLLKSKTLRDDAAEIVSLLGLKHSKTDEPDKKGRWLLRISRKKEFRQQSLQLFEPGTEKWLRFSMFC